MAEMWTRNAQNHSETTDYLIANSLKDAQRAAN
jgi:hypothetical protein